MRLLITGAAGFIGSHLVAAAERAGHEVHGIDLLTYAGRSANLTPEQRGRCEIGDVCDADRMLDMLQRVHPDAIIHLAAESHVARSIECRDEFLRTNVGGTLSLLEAALDWWRSVDMPRDFRLVHVSTDEVYGSLGPDDAPWTEQAPYRPNNPYAASKAASDHLVRSYWRTFALPCITTHSSNNYGPRQHPEKLIPTLIARVRDGVPIGLHGTGQHIRDWLHVDDHCEGLLRAAVHGEPGRTYNFGGRCERSNLQMAHLIHALIAPLRLPEIRLIADRPGNDARYATDCRLADLEFAWRPGPSVGARMAEVVRWYIDNPDYVNDYGR